MDKIILFFLFLLAFCKPTSFPLPYNGTYPSTYSYNGTFPSSFVWGMGTAAYQVEGGYNSGGRGATIWDTFSGANTIGMVGNNCTSAPCQINSAMVDRGATGNIADNQYEDFEKDFKLMKKMGLKNYRFSIAWSRILPTGRLADGINQQGINYYNKLINKVLEYGMQPYITLYHWDLPQALFLPNKGYYGWYSVDNQSKPNYQMTPHFVDYCNICFQNFGDRVKNWFTFNEPLTFCWQGSFDMAPNHPGYQDTSKWTYVAAHNVLNAHGKVVQLYRQKYQAKQKGRISITLNQDWREPKTHLQKDIDAAQRSVEFGLAWFADPLHFGDYPASMKQRIPNLPVFTPEESALLKGSTDFFALNHYTTAWAVNGTCYGWCPETAVLTYEGFLQSNSSWLYAVPWGLRKLVNWVNNRYGHIEIVVTENGWSEAANTEEHAYDDVLRMNYFANYTSQLLAAITVDKINITGYFGWSIFDNFEWAQGFSQRFGITFIDYNFGYDPNSPINQYQQPQAIQVHTRKKSSYWWQNMFETNSLKDPAYYYDDWFLNSSEILIDAVSASSILWGNQWAAFQNISNKTLLQQLTSTGLDKFVKGSSIQRIKQMVKSDLSNYLRTLCQDFSMDNSSALNISSSIQNQVQNLNHSTWMSFSIFYSQANSTLMNYFQLLINLEDSNKYQLVVVETQKQFSFIANSTVLFMETSVAGQHFANAAQLILKSTVQSQIFSDLLNFFYIVGIKAGGQMLGLNYTLPSADLIVSS